MKPDCLRSILFALFLLTSTPALAAGSHELEPEGDDESSNNGRAQGNAKSNREKFQEAALRLQKIFGRRVTVSTELDFAGSPTFQIDAGRNKEDAERVITKLIAAREAAGIQKFHLPFGTNSDGQITIHGGAIMNFGPGASDVKDETFEQLEKPANLRRFRAAFPAKKKSDEEKFAEAAARLENIFGRKVTVSEQRGLGGAPTFQIQVGRTKAEAEEMITRLLPIRGISGLSQLTLPLGSNDRGQITIIGGRILNLGPGDSVVIEETFEKLERHAPAFRRTLNPSKP